MFATLFDRRGSLGVAELVVAALTTVMVFMAIVTTSTVSACGMCSTGRLPSWVDIAGGITFVAAGFFLRVRRPYNALWILLVVAGMGRLVEVTVVQLPVAYFATWYGTYTLLLVAVPWHIALVFPTGRPLRGFKWLIPSVYLWAAGATVVMSSAVERASFTHFGITDRLVEGVAHADGWLTAVTALQRWDQLNILLGVAAILVRWVTGNRAVKRAFAPLVVVLPLAVIQAFVGTLPFIPATSPPWVTQLGLFALPVAVVVGIVGPRLWEGRLSDLVAQLDSATTALDVESAVRRAVDDPGLRVALRLSSGETFVDSRGDPIDVPLGDTGLATPILHGDQVLGALVHPRTADLSLMESVARTAALALRRIQLQAEVAVQLARVRRSRQRIVAAADEARRGIERDLHDGAQQHLVALAMWLDLEKNRFDDPAVHAVLDEAATQARTALEEVRRLSQGTYPPALASGGLSAAIEALVDASPIPVTVEVPDDRFDQRVETTAYFVVAEALTNAGKHARASEVGVRMTANADALEVDISDDGIGGAAPVSGSGLQGLIDRVEAVGGTVAVNSPSQGGTAISATIPIRP